GARSKAVNRSARVAGKPANGLRTTTSTTSAGKRVQARPALGPPACLPPGNAMAHGSPLLLSCFPDRIALALPCSLCRILRGACNILRHFYDLVCRQHVLCLPLPLATDNALFVNQEERAAGHLPGRVTGMWLHASIAADHL